MAAEDVHDGPARLALPGTRTRGAYRDDRLLRPEHRTPHAADLEVRARGVHAAGEMHHVLVRDIGIRHDATGHALRRDDLLQLLLRPDRDAFRIEGPGELGRVAPVLDVGDLLGRERDDSRIRVVAVGRVEDVEVATGGSQNNHVLSGHGWTDVRVRAAR